LIRELEEADREHGPCQRETGRLGFLAVDRLRGQQLKDTAQLDGWANDGGLEYVCSLCDFTA